MLTLPSQTNFVSLPSSSPPLKCQKVATRRREQGAHTGLHVCLKRAAAGIFFSLQSSSTPKCQKDLCLGHDFNSGASYFLPRHLWEFVCQFRTLPPIGHFLLVHFRDHVQKRVSRSWVFQHHWEICLSPFISTALTLMPFRCQKETRSRLEFRISAELLMMQIEAKKGL